MTAWHDAGTTSETESREEVRMHLAYRWFTRLDFEQEIPDHATFSKNRHGARVPSRVRAGESRDGYGDGFHYRLGRRLHDQRRPAMMAYFTKSAEEPLLK